MGNWRALVVRTPSSHEIPGGFAPQILSKLSLMWIECERLAWKKPAVPFICTEVR